MLRSFYGRSDTSPKINLMKEKNRIATASDTPFATSESYTFVTGVSCQTLLKSTARICSVDDHCGPTKDLEPTGFEPVTSSMPLRRSTN
jgi:hypothetical protein